MYSCTEDSLSYEEQFVMENSNHRSNSRSSVFVPRVEHGMLVFENFSELNDHFENLRQDDSDREVSVDNFNAIGITDDIKKVKDYYTFYPAVHRNNQESDFTSLLTIEESHLENQWNNERNYNVKMISKPYLKGVLNEHSAIKIGDRIIRVLPNNNFAVIANSDFEVYESIKNLQLEELRNDFNLRIVNQTNYSEYFTDYDNEGNVRESKKVIKPLLTTIQIDDNNYAVANKSFIELDQEVLFTWNIGGVNHGDGNHFNGPIPNDDDVTVAYGPADSTSPIGEVIATNRWCDLEICVIDLGYGYLVAPVEDFSEYSGNVVWFNGPYLSEDRIFTGNFIIVDYEDAGQEYYAEVQDENGLRRCITGLFIPENDVVSTCNGLSEKEYVEVLEPFSDGEVWRLNCLVWIETSGILDGGTPGELGSRTQSFRQNSNGSFSRREPAMAMAKSEGYFVDQDQNCRGFYHEDISWGANDDNIQSNTDWDGARMAKDGLFWSEHCIRNENGEQRCIRGLGDDGRFYLQQ
jgi:hypothetical protein